MVTVLGVLVCFTWYYTIISGFYLLYCPVLYIMFFNQQLYRTLADSLFSLWELFPVGLFQCCCKTNLHHYGDYVERDETTIVIMNHRTRVDWNYVWMSLYHATQEVKLREDDTNHTGNNTLTDRVERALGGKSKLKIVLKDELKGVPGLGWIMQLNYFLYLKRDWRVDQASLDQFVDYYRRMQRPCRLILFPEGTDLSFANRRRSDKFALDNNLPRLEFLLHPRNRGWKELCLRMRPAGLTSVYDVTIAYDVPAQTESDLLSGRWPNNVYFHIKRYSIEQLPEDEDDLGAWLNQRWREKEASLKQFHETGNFWDASTNADPLKRLPRSLTTAKVGFIFWIIVDILFTYALFNSLFFLFWVCYHSVLFTIVTWKFGGFQNIQYKFLERHMNFE